MRVSTLWPVGIIVSVSNAAVTGYANWDDAPAKNFIYIVPDGYGVASQVMARDYASLLKNGENPAQPKTYQLPADELHVGTVRTQSSDRLTTDSAAAATAYSSGFKTYAGAIGVNDDIEPVASILEAAKFAGRKTGLVVTSRITHATPGAYAAHAGSRHSEDDIALHQIGYSHPLGSVVDVLLGGGRCWYTPSTTEASCRTDDIDLLAFAKDKGYNVFTDRAGFDGLRGGENAPLPYLGLLADGHMSFELDRNATLQPSLLEMAKTAITSLENATKNSSIGYFLMIEASRIDHAGHNNDPVGHLHDALMYNNVLDFVRSWINEHPDTHMMAASDHETGGLTLHHKQYNPLILKPATKTVEVLAERWAAYTGDDAATFFRTDIFPDYGLTDATDAECAQLAALRGPDLEFKWKNALGSMLSQRGNIGWSTNDHSAADVALLAYSTRDEVKRNMAGNWDNTQLPLYLEKQLRVSLNDTTAALRAGGTDWVSKELKEAPNTFTRRHVH